MLAIQNGVPKILSLRQILGAYIEHQKEVVTRRTIFDKEKAEAVKETKEVVSPVNEEVAKQAAPAIEKVTEEAKTTEEAGDLLPEEIPDRAYPDTPVKKLILQLLYQKRIARK